VTDRLWLAYGLLALMLLIGAGLLLRLSRRRRKDRGTSSRIDVGVRD
jgi:hypothetical protein